MNEEPRSISWIEKAAAALGLVPGQKEQATPERLPDGRLVDYPPFERWQDWQELDAARRLQRYSLIPTTCFNCESGCGLLAYVNHDTGQVGPTAHVSTHRTGVEGEVEVEGVS